MDPESLDASQLFSRLETANGAEEFQLLKKLNEFLFCAESLDAELLLAIRKACLQNICGSKDVNIKRMSLNVIGMILNAHVAQLTLKDASAITNSVLGCVEDSDKGHSSKSSKRLKNAALRTIASVTKNCRQILQTPVEVEKVFEFAVKSVLSLKAEVAVQTNGNDSGKFSDSAWSSSTSTAAIGFLHPSRDSVDANIYTNGLSLLCSISLYNPSFMISNWHKILNGSTQSLYDYLSIQFGSEVRVKAIESISSVFWNCRKFYHFSLASKTNPSKRSCSAADNGDQRFESYEIRMVRRLIEGLNNVLFILDKTYNDVSIIDTSLLCLKSLLSCCIRDNSFVRSSLKQSYDLLLKMYTSDTGSITLVKECLCLLVEKYNSDLKDLVCAIENKTDGLDIVVKLITTGSLVENDVLISIGCKQLNTHDYSTRLDFIGAAYPLTKQKYKDVMVTEFVKIVSEAVTDHALLENAFKVFPVLSLDIDEKSTLFITSLAQNFLSNEYSDAALRESCLVSLASLFQNSFVKSSLVQYYDLGITLNTLLKENHKAMKMSYLNKMFSAKACYSENIDPSFLEESHVLLQFASMLQISVRLYDKYDKARHNIIRTVGSFSLLPEKVLKSERNGLIRLCCEHLKSALQSKASKAQWNACRCVARLFSTSVCVKELKSEILDILGVVVDSCLLQSENYKVMIQACNALISLPTTDIPENFQVVLKEHCAKSVDELQDKVEETEDLAKNKAILIEKLVDLAIHLGLD